MLNINELYSSSIKEIVFFKIAYPNMPSSDPGFWIMIMIKDTIDAKISDTDKNVPNIYFLDL